LLIRIARSRQSGCESGDAMANIDEKPLPAVGAYWIDEVDYPAALRIFDDGNTMPRTWIEWRKIAEEMEKGLKAYGHPVMRVRINPATFPAWCTAHGTSPGRQGRKLFVAAAVKERYGDQN
jgi:hypothetical protein